MTGELFPPIEPAPVGCTLAMLLGSLAAYRFLCGTEEDLQNQIAAALTREACPFTRELHLGEAGRIDFYLPGLQAGLEVKVDGSPNEVMRQLHRYAKRHEIRELVLMTSRARHRMLPTQLNDKPVHIVPLWEAGIL